MTLEERKRLAKMIENLGNRCNQVRNDLVAQGAPFVAGIIRVVEEGLLIAFNLLSDLAVEDTDL